MKKNGYRLLIVGMFVILRTYAFGHPHLFIENSFTFVFDDAGLAEVNIKWIFDEMYSSSIILDFDRNKNNRLEEKEIEAVKQGAFSNLENYHYFLYIKINNRDFPVTAITDFRAEIKDNKITYYFSIPLHSAATEKEKSVTVGCYDNTYFCDVFFSEEKPVELENDAAYCCSWKIIEDKKNSYWGGTIVPKIVSLKFRKKNE